MEKLFLLISWIRNHLHQVLLMTAIRVSVQKIVSGLRIHMILFSVVSILIQFAPSSEASVIYFSDTSGIYQYDQSSQSLANIIPNLTNVGSIAVVDSNLYWIEGISGDRKIRSYSIRNRYFRDVITIGDPNDISIDYINKKLYWSDCASMKIMQSNLDGTNLTEIANIHFGDTRIDVDSLGGKIYWTDIDNLGVSFIQQSNLDGSSASNLVSPGTSMGSDIAVDHEGGGLFSSSTPPYTFRHALDTGSTTPLTSGWWIGKRSYVAFDVAQRKFLMACEGNLWSWSIQDNYPFLFNQQIQYVNLDFRGITVVAGDDVASGYLTIQERPPEPEIPPEISGSGRKAVILTHGWNSRVEAWAVGMADQICVGVGGTAPTTDPASGYGNKLTLRCNTADWDVFVYDWSAMADTKAPWSAWANSVEHGTNLGKMLAKKDYAHVHLLAHSAGSMLIDSAKNWLWGMPKKPYIHLTFFDAYDPFAQIKDGKTLSAYGEGADWVDNYVDMRSLDTLFVSIMDGTKLLMPSAYNIDVTKWDAREQPLPPAAAIFRHEWPFVFYGESTFSPMTYDLGYQLSQEAGKTFPNPARKKKTVCTLPKQIVGTTPLACESTITVPNLETNTDKIHTIGDAYAVIQQVTNSVTGVINLIKNPVTGLIQYWGFSTGSPVWSKMDLDIKEPVNALTFDYEFLSAAGAEGYVTVFVDDNVVGHIDESKVVSSGIHASDRMYIGELAPGAHTLVVRVDPYTDVQSSVKLSNLNLVYVNKEAKFPWNMFLPAITHKVQ